MISTARELTQDNLEVLKTCLDPDQIDVIWVGDKVTTDLILDKHYDRTISAKDIVVNLIERLEEEGTIFKAW